jgi:hypothetical protein
MIEGNPSALNSPIVVEREKEGLFGVACAICFVPMALRSASVLVRTGLV